MDRLTPEQRRHNMQRVKSKDTSIEIRLRHALWKEGIRYRKNYSGIPGHPDIAITKYKIAVFCDSSFWHGRSKLPQTNGCSSLGLINMPVPLRRGLGARRPGAAGRELARYARAYSAA